MTLRRPANLDGPWLYLPVEVATRDLDARLLVACCAAERGYAVVIGRKKELAEHYSSLPRGMILDKSLATVRSAQFARLKRLGFRLSASEEESIWIYREPEQFLKMRVAPENIERADYYFSWGRKQSDLIADAYPGAARILRTVGSPRLDLARPEFHRLHREAVSAIKRRFGRFILLPSSFSLVLDKRGGRNSYEEMRRRHGGSEDTAEADALTRMLDHFDENFRAFAAVLPRVRERFPDHHLVVRPHPGDDPRHWEEATESIERCDVVFEGSVTPWLLAAEGMFHHGCTTGVESYLMGKPAIAYHPVLRPEYDNHLSTRLGPVARDETDLLDLMARAIAGESLPRGDESWFDDFLKTSGEQYAADRMVDCIDEIALPRERLDSPRNRLRAAAAGAKRRLRGSQKRRRLDQGWDAVSLDSLTTTLQLYREATDRFDGVRIEELGESLYLLPNA